MKACQRVLFHRQFNVSAPKWIPQDESYRYTYPWLFHNGMFTDATLPLHTHGAYVPWEMQHGELTTQKLEQAKVSVRPYDAEEQQQSVQRLSLTET